MEGMRMIRFTRLASPGLAILVLVTAAVVPPSARAAGERSRVLVRMEVASSVQSQADDGVEAGAEQRRRRIRAARERVTAPLKRRPAAGVVVRAFDEIPWVALEVDGEALEALRADPGVLAVRPDTIERALLVESSASWGLSTCTTPGLPARVGL